MGLECWDHTERRRDVSSKGAAGPGQGGPEGLGKDPGEAIGGLRV